MKPIKLLGIKIDYVRIDQSCEIVSEWLKKRGKHYIVTPNPEMIVDSKFNTEFKLALNEASLAVPDSPRLGWASQIIKTKNPFFRLTYFPFFLFPQLLGRKNYPTTKGIDLMEELIRLSQEKAFTTAYLGGSKTVADKLRKCLRAKYPRLKIAFCLGGIRVDKNGKTNFDIENNKKILSKDVKRYHGINPHELSKNADILFVAFGHIKQEIWMQENLPKLNAKIMMGVGGAFDYLSGSVPRAPRILQSLGLEWLFRFFVQPWRIKRFWKLPYFLYMVMSSK